MTQITNTKCEKKKFRKVVTEKHEVNRELFTKRANYLN